MTQPARTLSSDPPIRPWTPTVYRVVDTRQEISDVTTLFVARADDQGEHFHHGQFNMLTAFGVGEAAISVSSAPGAPGPIEHTIRDVGPVTHALCSLTRGDVLGLRGPFGTDWGIEDGVLRGTDVVIVAGGIGLAPLRGAVRDLVVRQHREIGRLFVLVGARSPDQIVFADELTAWRRDGVHVEVSVDIAGPTWRGAVGVVTSLVSSAPFDPKNTVAFVCGPEIMMRLSAQSLISRGVHPRNIRISLERSMACGVALCGHCQLGPLLVCRDGPVVTYAGVVAELLLERRR